MSRELNVQKVMMCHAVIADKLALCRTGLHSSTTDQDSRQSGCITQPNHPADRVWRTAHSWEEIECECLCECVTEGPGGPGERESHTTACLPTRCSESDRDIHGASCRLVLLLR